MQTCAYNLWINHGSSASELRNHMNISMLRIRYILKEQLITITFSTSYRLIIICFIFGTIVNDDCIVCISRNYSCQFINIVCTCECVCLCVGNVECCELVNPVTRDCTCMQHFSVVYTRYALVLNKRPITHRPHMDDDWLHHLLFWYVLYWLGYGNDHI